MTAYRLVIQEITAAEVFTSYTRWLCLFAGDRNGWFSIRFLLRAGDRNGRFCQPQIPAYCFAIDPQLARNPSLRPSTIGQAVNRCLQAHFEDIRHAPLNLFLPGPMELFCFP